jgi:1-acyl-sn-glycerol-3-phosphate acyltransferase
LFQKWFRVETQGLENVPDVGGALVVANHSGTLPADALMTMVALRDEHPAQRRLRLLGADLVFDLPFLGTMSRKMGTTLACNEDAERLLTEGEVVGVFPEGFKGIGKPFRERYTLQRFGRGGFVTAALRTGKPIIPCAIVGAEEIYPMIGNAKTAARLLGLPYFPITPTFPLLGPLGLLPLPSKWLIAFGEPIETASYGPAAAEDPMLVFNLTDQVRETIQHSLYQLLLQRKSVFS